ncbi:MAG: CoA transferase [Acidaminococcaceae bacterium]|nr:CoA transferase [Acidaminococcaceae bacterium]HBX75046.1 CoA transferase [Acidaminococcaceae bacterium]
MTETALQGIKVIDFSQWLPGQYCGMVLADFGADVIKVEGVKGDPNRSFAPQLADGMSSWNLALNRNKRGITVNLKTEEGKEILKCLLRQADVFLEGFRPGYLQSKGLGYEEVKMMNPRLIYCSISGFGQEGRYRQQPAHDLNIIGLSGMNFLNDRNKVAISEVQVSAIGSSLNAVAAISMALFARERSGKGQYIDVSLYNTALSMQIVSLASILGCRATGDTPFGRRAHYYDVYPTKDGKYISVGTIEPKFWQKFCDMIELPELKERQFDFAHEDEITQMISSRLKTKTRDEWAALAENGTFCVTPVYSPEEVLDRDMTATSGMLETRREDIGPVTYLRSPMKLSGTPAIIRFRAPYAGEHNREVLEMLGYTEEVITGFEAKGVI